jgi:hypothetical protein
MSLLCSRVDFENLEKFGRLIAYTTCNELPSLKYPATGYLGYRNNLEIAQASSRFPYFST